MNHVVAQSLSMLVGRATALMHADSRYRDRPGIWEPVHISEVLDLIVTLALEVDELKVSLSPSIAGAETDNIPSSEGESLK